MGFCGLSDKQAKIVSVVCCYFTISITLVFVNKVLLSADSVSIPAPMFITWYQCVVTALICWGLGLAGRGAKEGTFLAQFPEPRFEPARSSAAGHAPAEPRQWQLRLYFFSM